MGSFKKRYSYSLPFFTFAFLLLGKSLPAQEFNLIRNIDPFPVRVNNSTNLEFPFLGGFNAPRPQFVDIDSDGDLDLFIQEQSSTFSQPGQLIFFENTGTSTHFVFSWITDWYNSIDVGNWFRFIDLDFDGDYDLLTESPFSLIRYYRNEGTTNDPTFVSVADSLRDMNGDLIFFDLSSMPDLVDIDCDGDLDLFIGRLTGSITFYENVGRGANGVPQFEFVTDQFQGISIIGQTAVTSVKPGWDLSTSHGANSLSFIDIDNDQDQDMFFGDLFEPSIVFLENTGTCSDPEISITTRRYPVSNPLLSSGFNVPRFADLDGDGDYDMFIGVLGFVFGSTQNLAENFLYFQNMGSPEQPAFSPVSSQFLTTLDIGANSIPAFVDIDHDGDFDLFLANEADPQDSQRSQLYFFENQGTAASPVFQLIDADFLNLAPGFNYAPTFVDIDDDGDQDMFIGGWDGKLSYFENVGSAESPDFVAVDQNFDGIDVGNNNAPTFVDIDDDGDFDMFIGEFLGNINFFQNVGSADSCSFVQDTAPYFGIDVGLYSFPTFSDIDRDGDQDLILGSDDAGIIFYRNVGTTQIADFVQDTTFSVPVMNRSIPVFFDIDNDGDLDFFAGGNRGGLVFYENTVNSPRMVGDVTSDGVVNVQDLIRVINIILDIGQEPTEVERAAADVNNDSVINVSDLIGIINIILGIG